MSATLLPTVLLSDSSSPNPIPFTVAPGERRHHLSGVGRVDPAGARGFSEPGVPAVGHDGPENTAIDNSPANGTTVLSAQAGAAVRAR